MEFLNNFITNTINNVIKKVLRVMISLKKVVTYFNKVEFNMKTEVEGTEGLAIKIKHVAEIACLILFNVRLKVS